MVKPTVRFPEFKDSWNNYKIEDIFDKVGVAVNLDDTRTYCEIGIRSHGKGIFHKEETTATEIGNKRVFWVESGCFVVNIVFAWERAVAKTTEKENGMIASHRFPMYKPKEDIVDLDYITEYFVTKRGQNVLILASPGGAGRNKTLGQKEFAKSVVKLPSLPEQQKIAEFLSTIDTVIEKQKETISAWEERKKGVIQKLFSQEVRFKADDGSEFPEWEKKKIGDIFSKVKDKNKDGQNQNVITNSAEFGLINQRDFFDKDIVVDGKTENYTVIKTGDFVYNPRKSKQAPYGPFNCYQLEEDGIVSPLYTCLRPKGNTDDKYLHWYFRSGCWYRFIYENGAQNGARHDRVGMTDSLMQEIPVYLPQAVEERQKIADCLTSLDEVIEKQKATLAAWEELKKGLLQQMFV